MTDETRAAREDRIQENVQAKKAAASSDSRESYCYVGYKESGDWDTFSDELEASRYALEGSKARVEKKVLRKRAK